MSEYHKIPQFFNIKKSTLCMLKKYTILSENLNIPSIKVMFLTSYCFCFISFIYRFLVRYWWIILIMTYLYHRTICPNGMINTLYRKDLVILYTKWSTKCPYKSRETIKSEKTFLKFEFPQWWACATRM